DLDAAGLAAPAGVDLRLHYPDGAAKHLRGLHRLLDAEGGRAARHRHAEPAQQALGLVFVDVHVAPGPTPSGLSCPAAAGHPAITKPVLARSSRCRRFLEPACSGRSPSGEIRRDLPAGVDQRLHRLRGFLEARTLRAVQLDLDHPLGALAADYYGDADVQVLDTVLAVEPRGAGQHALLVEQVALRH